MSFEFTSLENCSNRVIGILQLVLISRDLEWSCQCKYLIIAYGPMVIVTMVSKIPRKCWAQ